MRRDTRATRAVKTALDKALYTIGQIDEVKGTGVWSWYEEKRVDGAGALTGKTNGDSVTYAAATVISIAAIVAVAMLDK